MVYGYIRVSTREQNDDRQRLAIAEAGVSPANFYTDRQSGKDFDRPAYRRLIRRLGAGDTLIIQSIDRLGRNYAEILEQWRVITRERGAGIVVLDMPLLDTRKKSDLTGTLIADIVLQLLSYVAETERAMILKRQREGIEAARMRGVRFGRPPRALPEGYDALYRRWQAKELTLRAAASACGLAPSTFRYYATRRGADQ